MRKHPRRPLRLTYKLLAGKAASKKWYLANKDKVIARTNNNHYLTRYGISRGDANKLLSEQYNLCAICKKLISIGGTTSNSAHVDHDHITGEIRGMLCNSCNVGLGHLGDNITTLSDAINYLRDFKKRSEKIA